MTDQEQPPLPEFLTQPQQTKTVISSTQTTGPIAASTESWFTSSWRPLACYVYLMICVFDFMGAPIALAALNAYQHIPNTHDNSWVPLTTTGGAIFHLSFGAIIGISAFGRTREKIAYDGGGDMDTPTNNPRSG